MPTEDKPLPAIHVQSTDETQPWLLRPQDDIVFQIREATYSPSPLVRILQDPSILPPDSPDYPKTRLNGRSHQRLRPSRSPRREHRSEVVAAIAIAEEEKQSRQLKTLLHSSGERLEYEIRRADDAILRAEIAERQEKAYLARAKAAEAEKEELRRISNELEGEVRNYQMQMEAGRREVQSLQAELEEKRREMEELRDEETRALGVVKKYQRSLHEVQLQMREQDLQMQNALDRWYDTGREEGYGEGYDDGYKGGRKIGVKEGLKRGRREGMREGMEQGRHEERQNAIEAFDRFLSKEMHHDDEQKIERIRRWAQSIYHPDGNSETVYPVDSASA